MKHYRPDITAILKDMDVGSQQFVILRPGGAWQNGRYETGMIELEAYGNIQPASQEELKQLPEGDRAGGIIVIRASADIRMPGGHPSEASDEVRWQGNIYKVLAVKPWWDYGFCEAFLTKK